MKIFRGRKSDDGCISLEKSLQVVDHSPEEIIFYWIIFYRCFCLDRGCPRGQSFSERDSLPPVPTVSTIEQ